MRCTAEMNNGTTATQCVNQQGHEGPHQTGPEGGGDTWYFVNRCPSLFVEGASTYSCSLDKGHTRAHYSSQHRIAWSADKRVALATDQPTCSATSEHGQCILDVGHTGKHATVYGPAPGIGYYWENDHTQREEKIDHPSHYGGAESVYEAIKVIEAWGLGFHLGNCVKYICRAGYKPGSTRIDDLKKAKWYLDRELQQCTETEVSKKLGGQ